MGKRGSHRIALSLNIASRHLYNTRPRRRNAHAQEIVPAPPLPEHSMISCQSPVRSTVKDAAWGSDGVLASYLDLHSSVQRRSW
jgi:hypothetical protein